MWTALLINLLGVFGAFCDDHDDEFSATIRGFKIDIWKLIGVVLYVLTKQSLRVSSYDQRGQSVQLCLHTL